MEMQDYLNGFETALEQGLVKICRTCELLGDENLDDGRPFVSPDIEECWERYVKDYVADAVSNFNEWPDAAIGFAGFLGMAVAYNWDRDWLSHRNDGYSSYYGGRGFDDMDDHILEDVLALDEKDRRYFSDFMISCSTAVQVLLRREQIEPQTDTGFYALVRSYGVMFRIGAAVELNRLGYKKMLVV